MTVSCVTNAKITDDNQWRTQNSSERCKKMLKFENKEDSTFLYQQNVRKLLENFFAGEMRKWLCRSEMSENGQKSVKMSSIFGY